ncbi:MAG: 30S ribosomal protein S27ae [Thermoplasmatota archaeon]
MTGQANTLYKIEGGKIVRTHRQCPKCGVGVFMAAHKDRTSCGRCGYTEFHR